MKLRRYLARLGSSAGARRGSVAIQLAIMLTILLGFVEQVIAYTLQMSGGSSMSKGCSGTNFALGGGTSKLVE